MTLILAGLVVSLYRGAINQLLVLFHHDQLQKHVPVEYRHADPDRLEYCAASVAAACWRRHVDAAAVTSADADGAG